ncbi:putative endoribonuclease L-PSP, YjgF-like protein [Ramicandelaber brevisporus]|nr:putative endoribonuclease L-PSP, YjgF-like protein [Ramicandelaber brevisporus]
MTATTGEQQQQQQQQQQRTNFGSGGPWEARVGYSRAVRVGNQVFIAGSTAVEPATGELVGKGDAYAQAVQTLKTIRNALEQAGASVEHVVRTRMFVTNIQRDWEAIGKAHGEVFGDIRPVATMVEVKGLINPDMLVEIEADAIIA